MMLVECLLLYLIQYLHKVTEVFILPTIEEMNNSMTVYFSKSNGNIKSISTGIQDMSLFASNADDYSIIWDFVVAPKDDYVMKNKDSFKINLETKILEMVTNPTLNYPVASS